MTLTFANAGKLWWGAGKVVDKAAFKWAGRSSRNLGVAKPGVYDAKLVVLDPNHPDAAHTFTGTWQVRVN